MYFHAWFKVLFLIVLFILCFVFVLFFFWFGLIIRFRQKPTKIKTNKKTINKFYQNHAIEEKMRRS